MIVIGVIVVVAQPAAASTWQPYTQTSKWHCKAIEEPYSFVAFRACVVVNGNYTQAVTVAQSTTNAVVYIEAPLVNLYQDGDVRISAWCGVQRLFPHASLACFGATQTAACTAYVQARAFVTASPRVTQGTQYSGFSPTRRMCTM
jgi:hypothetical protein